jgi:competence protein ComFC
MEHWWKKLQHMLSCSVNVLPSMLSAGSCVCLLCNKKNVSRAGSPLTSLCTECRKAIPWINRIFCSVCGRPVHCPDCARRLNTSFVCNRSAVRYSPHIRHWLALYKYRGHEALLPLLGEMMVSAFGSMQNELSHRHAGFEFDALIPVPVSKERQQERGFNQAERFADYLAGRTGVPLFGILQRTRNSDKQSSKTRMARLHDTRELFKADDSAMSALIADINGRRPVPIDQSLPIGEAKCSQALIRLLLIDDIYTTGSTAEACSRALVKAAADQGRAWGTEVYVLTLARS